MNHKVNINEAIKTDSNYLRGTVVQSLGNVLTGAVTEKDTHIIKFHGLYQQDNRDIRQQRKEMLLEPYFNFMLRARLPGGVCTPEQWLTIDEVARTLSNGTLRLTTRQTFQYHGIVKRNLKPVIQKINQAMIDSIGGCGDVNRNVLCGANSGVSPLQKEIYTWAKRISEHLLPKTHAYHEIWLDGKKLEADSKSIDVNELEIEPVYGKTYLPRKFKTAIALPPYNDVDVYANDMGFIAIVENEKLLGFNVLAGGGMGTTHGDQTTFPRLADTLGFIEPEHVLAVSQAIIMTQRDFGNRVERKYARLKYTIETMGVTRFRDEVSVRAGVKFEASHPVIFKHHGDRPGWTQGDDGLWHLNLFIENGRLSDSPAGQLLTGLRCIAQIHEGVFRITANQNLEVSGVASKDKNKIEDIAIKYGLLKKSVSLLRQNSMACVAFPTCPQAMAEAERYFPSLVTRIEMLARRYGINDQSIVMRMTGCPNGCARPFLAEIGFVGKAPGRYNLFLGGDGTGTRINKLYRENIDESTLLEILDGLFRRYASERQPGERFGDFTIRENIIACVHNPAADFHEVGDNAA